MSREPHRLRELASQIKELAKAHPYYSQAHAIVENCCDHLCAVARTHELTAELQEKSHD